MKTLNEESNYNAEGKASIKDNDLLDAYIALRQDVPSVVCLLEELQYLRDLTKSQNKKLDIFYLAFESVNDMNCKEKL